MPASGGAAPGQGAGDTGSGHGAYLRLIAVGAAIGMPAAVVAALFLALVEQCEHWLWTDLPHALGDHSPPWYLVMGLPVVGGLVVLGARRLLPGDGGHRPLQGFAGAPTAWQYAPGVALAALGTLGFGAVLGPEAPLIAIGSATGMLFVAVTKVRGRGEQVLSTAGSFSAVSALFGGPLVAGILLLEGGLAQGAALLPALLPGLTAAAVGYVLFVGFGDWGGLHHQGLLVPNLPPYHGTPIGDLGLALAVGLASAVVIVAVRWLAARITPWAARRMAAVLVAGALVVGVVAELAHLLGAASQDVLFSGQASVPALVAETSTGILVLLLVAKALTYGVCLGCGFRGGPVFPAIFLGIALASFPVIWFGTSPTWAVAVGSAAGMAAGTRLVFSPLLFSVLLVGTHGLDVAPASVLGTVAAWLAAEALRRRFRVDVDLPPSSVVRVAAAPTPPAGPAPTPSRGEVARQPASTPAATSQPAQTPAVAPEPAPTPAAGRLRARFRPRAR